MEGRRSSLPALIQNPILCLTLTSKLISPYPSTTPTTPR